MESNVPCNAEQRGILEEVWAPRATVLEAAALAFHSLIQLLLGASLFNDNKYSGDNVWCEGVLNSRITTLLQCLVLKMFPAPVSSST